MLAKLQRPSSQAFPTTLHYKLRMRDERCDAMRGEKIIMGGGEKICDITYIICKVMVHLKHEQTITSASYGSF
jgi:hypothetical protein